jgi:hypothetical protein
MVDATLNEALGGAWLQAKHLPMRASEIPTWVLPVDHPSVHLQAKLTAANICHFQLLFGTHLQFFDRTFDRDLLPSYLRMEALSALPAAAHPCQRVA